MNSAFPPFRPLLWLRNGHAQTLAALALARPRRLSSTQRHHVTLADGDVVVLSDDHPDGWRPGDRAALLVHGLAGCHQSPYMRRIADKLTRAGVRAFRLDLRGCGAGAGLARTPYHAGLTGDLRAALEEIAFQCPLSPISVIGFSLGGNLVLKLLGEAADAPLAGVDRGIAVCPPIDLAYCCRMLAHGLGRWYDRHFVTLLAKQARHDARRTGRAIDARLMRRPRSLFEFDDAYTAPISGFNSAEHYYHESSAIRYLPKITLPTTMLVSRDDPVVPYRTFESVALPPSVRFVETAHGGHLGFIGQRGADADWRWMDWRVIEWAVR